MHLMAKIIIGFMLFAQVANGTKEALDDKPTKCVALYAMTLLELMCLGINGFWSA